MTDIVVLVVAADDGVMPQTVEAINHAKAAGVPLIVAINKIDMPGADPNRVRTALLQHEIVVESMSGETLEVEVSALKRTGLDKLLEAISLQAELLDLQANPDRSAEGVVIEAKLERGRGPVGTVLVQRGTLRVGDIVVAGAAWGRVRALIDDRGETVAGGRAVRAGRDPGLRLRARGGRSVRRGRERGPRARDHRLPRAQAPPDAGLGRHRAHARADDAAAQGGGPQGVPAASSRATCRARSRPSPGRCASSAPTRSRRAWCIRASAASPNPTSRWPTPPSAVVVGFNVRANAQAKLAADQIGVEIRYYNIIYDLVDDVKKAMSGLLSPTLREIFLGNAEILEVFNISKVGKVAGCRVTDGKVERGAKVRLIRDNVVIHEGTLSTLKRFKDEVREVPAGQECGMAFANYQDIRAGDVIECFNVETIARSL